MSPKLALLGLLDLAVGVALLVATATTLGTVAGWVLVATGAAVVIAALRRRPLEPSADEGLRRAAADQQREETTTQAARDRVEDGGYQTGGQ